MKILFIGSYNEDYQGDVVLHGLRQLLGSDVIDIPKKPYVYKEFPENMKLHGNGFTTGRILSDIPVDREMISEKIEGRFFDAVIFGSSQRNRSYLSLVLENYKKQQIILIDGEDETALRPEETKYATVYKRELSEYTDGVHPISFGFPREKIKNYQNKYFKKNPGSKNERSLSLIENIDDNEYEDLVEEIFDYSYNNLTTAKVAARILDNL